MRLGTFIDNSKHPSHPHTNGRRGEDTHILPIVTQTDCSMDTRVEKHVFFGPHGM